MALTSKPFVLADKLIRRIFKPKPNILADVDINQQSEAFVSAIDNLAGRLGAITKDFETVGSSVSLAKVSTTYTLTYDIAINDYTGVPFDLYHKSVKFSVPGGTWSGTVVKVSQLPKLAIWLVATPHTIKFSGASAPDTNDQAVAGVRDTGTMPSPLASSDAYVWGDERLELVTDEGTPTLGAGEVAICKVLSVGYQNMDQSIIAPYITVKYKPIIINECPDRLATDEYPQSQALITEVRANNLYEDTRRLWLKIQDFTDKFASLAQLFNYTGYIPDPFPDYQLLPLNSTSGPTYTGSQWNHPNYATTNYCVFKETLDGYIELVLDIKSPTGGALAASYDLADTFLTTAPDKDHILMLYAKVPLKDSAGGATPTVVHLKLTTTGELRFLGGDGDVSAFLNATTEYHGVFRIPKVTLLP